MRNTLHGNIMRRIYIIYSLRRVFSLFMVKVYCALAIVVGLAMTVSIPDVLGNTPHSINAISYLGHAFVSTEGMVKALLVIALVLWAWLTKDLIFSIYQNRSKLSFRLGAKRVQA